MVQPVLIDGSWRAAAGTATFRASNPETRQPLLDEYPVSEWSDCDLALDSAHRAAETLRQLPAERLAEFLERYAEAIDANAESLVELAHQETGLPASPRLADVELPRTSGQLRQAAAAAREGSWALPTIDRQANIRSQYEPLGPVAVFGPNNFPFAFGSISGGDFAAAIAAGNPVIAKANSSHPGTTRLFAQLAHAAAQSCQLPAGTVQLLYRLNHEDGERLVADRRLGATGYTGSRQAGLKLKAAADAAGKPIYLELSSVNPVVLLPGALRERLEALVDEFSGSCLMGAGQFCTNPGLILLTESSEAEEFLERVRERFASTPGGTLLSEAVERSLEAGIATLLAHGAELLTGQQPAGDGRCARANTLLKVSGRRFLESPEALQTEAFGNASLAVVADDLSQLCDVIDQLEGNLTGCVYSSVAGDDDPWYGPVATHLRPRVGRLLNDKMPTGVAVSPAMNHGGPYPATGHPGFTAVGIPASLLRFARLACYDNVRPERLPPALRDPSPNGTMWRRIDGVYSQSDVGS